MRSTGGDHYLGLDHIRAIAALMVFSWHFLHASYGAGYPVPFANPPALLPAALFDEGHTGVALFMTLSGYLFAKLLDNKKIIYKYFLWNRFIRLAPLLALVIMVRFSESVVLSTFFANIYSGKSPTVVLKDIAYGLIAPTWPNGGWSITTEMHFYLVLPLMLIFFRRYRIGVVVLLATTILMRIVLYSHLGELQRLSYWTIIGRIDQFMIGIVAFQLSQYLVKRHWLAGSVAISFVAFYWLFDYFGGWHNMPTYPSPSIIWIILPTIEGLTYGILIAYYDRNFEPTPTGFSWFIAKIGAYSYSIYLLHFFVVDHEAYLIDTYIVNLSNWYVAEGAAILCFLMMIPIGYLSFRFIESPFLQHRIKYTITSGEPLKYIAPSGVAYHDARS